MNTSTRNTERAESKRPRGGESEDVETQANRLAADREAKLAVEGLNRLAREKAAAKKSGDKPRTA